MKTKLVLALAICSFAANARAKSSVVSCSDLLIGKVSREEALQSLEGSMAVINEMNAFIEDLSIRSPQTKSNSEIFAVRMKLLELQSQAHQSLDCVIAPR